MTDERKKIAIFTLTGYFNYGNRLQAYASSQIFDYLGLDTEVIIISEKRRLSKALLLYESKKGVFSLIFKIIRKLVRLVFKKDKKIDERYNIRTERFKSFSSKYLNEKDYGIRRDYIPDDFVSKFDYFVVGSDQVWHIPTYIPNDVFLLPFGKKEQKFSLAASIAYPKEVFMNFSNELKSEFKRRISDMKYVSVREKEGAEIIKEVVGVEAEVLSDPTMFLSKSEWLKIAQKPNIKHDLRVQSNFILCYFLGNITPEYKSKIDEIATKNKLEVIHINLPTDKTAYLYDPSEFIWLINNAKLVCTDSFHGLVFAIVMNTPFIVFDRIDKVGADMNSRIETILSKFNLENRKFENISTEEILNMDFSEAVKSIDIEREYTTLFLLKVLST